jgi:hypothetical protein
MDENLKKNLELMYGNRFILSITIILTFLNNETFFSFSYSHCLELTYLLLIADIYGALTGSLTSTFSCLFFSNG